MKQVPPRFSKGYEAIKALARLPRYEAAFIFGSVADGTSDAKSDLDVRVVVDQDNACDNVNHPVFDDYKLDVSFASYKQIKGVTDSDMEKGERRPVLAAALIVFDKTGQITALRKVASEAKPKKYTEKDYLFTQFMLYHANDKVTRYMETEPLSAFYSMHANIGEVLKHHYRLKGKWWVSSKRILDDLKLWDGDLANLLQDFVRAVDVKQKYAFWSEIIDHVTLTMGGRQPIAENNCSCPECTTDLAALVSKSREK